MFIKPEYDKENKKFHLHIKENENTEAMLVINFDNTLVFKQFLDVLNDFYYENRDLKELIENQKEAGLEPSLDG